MQRSSNKHLYKYLSLSFISLSVISLTSCGSNHTPAKPPQTKTPTTVKIDNKNAENSLDEEQVKQSAITYKAKYGVTYEIIGNVIAQYPHFDLTIFGKQSIHDSDKKTTTYELTSKDGFAKTHIMSDPRQRDKKHFYLENLHFYYHSNAADQITIYMPPQLLANR